MKALLCGGIALFFVLLAGCSTENPADTRLAQRQSPPAPAQADSSDTAAAADPLASIWKEQKLIRDAQMSVQVESVDQAVKDVEAIARKYDGMVADREAQLDRQGSRRQTIKMRVPAARFDAAMDELRGLGTVQWEKITTEDITKAYADLETRLSVKRTAEERLRAILSSKTGNLADVLAAERELSRVTEEIETLLGEKRYYDHRVAVSTISIELQAAAAMAPRSLIAPVSEALRASLMTLSRSAALLIYFGVFLAPWVVIVSVVWWAVGKFRRRTSSAKRASS